MNMIKITRKTYAAQVGLKSHTILVTQILKLLEELFLSLIHRQPLFHHLDYSIPLQPAKVKEKMATKKPCQIKGLGYAPQCRAPEIPEILCA